jgi:hypothetical protein
MNRPTPLLPMRPGGSDISEGVWRYFLDMPIPDEELQANGESHWLNYRLRTDSSTFGSPHDGGTGFARRLWALYEADVLAAWVERFPGTRPSTWWRFGDIEALPNEATWQMLDDLGLWLPGERERAVEMFGPLRKRAEAFKTPMHPEWDRRGRERPRRD